MDRLKSLNPATGAVVGEVPLTPVSAVPEIVARARAAQAGWAALGTRARLGAVVFGRDEENAAAVARRLTAGMIGINRSVGGVAGTPWVGARQSGFGFHKSRDGHRQFTQTRVVTLAL